MLCYRKYFWDYTRVHLEIHLWQVSDFCLGKGREDTYTYLPNFIWIMTKIKKNRMVIFKKLSIEGLFKCFRKVNSVECLDDSVIWTSDSWFWLRLWSQGCGIKPQVGLHAECASCFRVSLSLSLFVPLTLPPSLLFSLPPSLSLFLSLSPSPLLVLSLSQNK